jgi:predicted GNAT family acetyltransferase
MPPDQEAPLWTQVRENLEQHRFELPISGGAVAAAYYRVENGRVVLFHTEVPSEFSGQGYASQLARGAFELIRQSDRTVIIRCPFMNGFLTKHPEYRDIIAG